MPTDLAYLTNLTYLACLAYLTCLSPASPTWPTSPSSSILPTLPTSPTPPTEWGMRQYKWIGKKIYLYMWICILVQMYWCEFALECKCIWSKVAVEAVQCVTILTLMAAREGRRRPFVKLFLEEGLIWQWWGKLLFLCTRFFKGHNGQWVSVSEVVALVLQDQCNLGQIMLHF